jgi:hypothetical protein
MSDVFKTYAAPMATILASVVALFASVAALVVTIYFNRVQASIARSQAATAAAQKEIAFDKLKFDKRYEIYLAVKAIIEATRSRPAAEVEGDPALSSLRLKLGEARFFFPPDTQTLCENIEKQVNQVLVGEVGGVDPRRAEKMNKALIELAQIYINLPKHFERDLRFEQLTKPI